jgi:hypothetical protein
MAKGRDNRLICLRNRALVARYYYYAEIWEKAYDKTLCTLSEHEFFISQYTIEDELKKCEGYLKELRQKAPTIKELECLYPGFCWRVTMNVRHPKRLAKITRN